MTPKNPPKEVLAVDVKAMPPETLTLQSNTKLLIWQALIAAVVTIALAWIQLETQKSIERQGVEARKQAITVAKTLEENTAIANESMATIKKSTHDTHTLVNSAMGVQLKLTHDLSEWKASQTKDAVDIEAAKLAKEKLDAHNEQQKKVDAHL